jgi:YHS domain-containing protein
MDEDAHAGDPRVPRAPRATVCHRVMTASIDWYPTAQYQGRTIYFCTEFCLEAFLADPDRFYAAHSRVKK